MKAKCCVMVLAVGLLSGCAVEVSNVEAPKALAQENRAPGSVYLGWRIFQDKCAQCHGPNATGSANAPDLLPRVSAMGPRRFVDVVLRRYDWSMPASQSGVEGAAREAFVDQLLQRQVGSLAMPAWQQEPRVNAHIADLYAWLSARAEGRQAPGRPPTTVTP